MGNRNPIKEDLLIGALMLCTVLAAYMAGANHDVSSDLDLADIPSASERGMEAELAELRLMLNNLKDRVYAATNSRANASSATSSPQKQSAGSTAEPQTAIKEGFAPKKAEREAQMLAQANAQYYAEQVEQKWADAKEQSIAELLKDKREFHSLDMDELQCRSHSCRLVLNMKEPAESSAAMELVGQVGQELPFAQWHKQGRQLVVLLSERDLTQLR